MTKLSDTQLIILSAAAQRDDRIALPLPPKLKGGAATKVVATMIAKGLIQELPARRIGLQDGDPVWHESKDGRATTLAITLAGLAAIGVELEDDMPDAATNQAAEADSPQPATSADTPALTNGANHDASAGGSAPTATTGATVRTPREGTKQTQLIAMLRQPGGATIDEIATELQWAGHTIRGAISGALKKKLGLTVTSEKIDGRGRAYFIVNKGERQ